MGWKMTAAQPQRIDRQVFKGAVSAVIGPVEAGEDDAFTIDDVLDDWDRKRAISQALTKLSPREERVIRMLFGLDGSERTLAEVGEHFGVSPERIRQIECKALRKLRHPSRGKALSTLVPGAVCTNAADPYRPRPPFPIFQAPPPRPILGGAVRISPEGPAVPVRIKRWVDGDDAFKRALGLPGPYAIFDHEGQEYASAKSEFTALWKLKLSN